MKPSTGRVARPRSRRGTTAPEPIRLPPPRLGGGARVLAALRSRRTTREIAARPLPLRVLSNLLWAACGVNRTDGPFGYPGLTAASASDSQEIDVYVALAAGVYRFEPRGHRLVPVTARDLRSLAIGRGQRAMVTDAPVQIVYVADVHKLTHTAGFREPGLLDPAVQRSYYYVDTGMIAGNVYVYAAAAGLACWFHNCDRPALRRALGLGAGRRVLFAQTVGYPQTR